MTEKTFPYELVGEVDSLIGYQRDVYGEVVAVPTGFTAGTPDTATPDYDVEEEGRPVAGDTYTYSWEADFTPEQEDEWDTIVKKARRRTEPPDEAALEPHFDTLKAYWNAPNPTAAQTVQAMKSVIFILREMWKE